MASSLASLVMLSSGWDKQESHAKLFCSQWPVARVSFFTERTQYQAIWLRMNKNVICVRSTSRARAVLFSCVQYNSNWSNRHIKRCFSGTYWSVFQPSQGTHTKLSHFIAVIKKGSFLSWAGDGLFFADWKFVSSFTQQKSTRIRQCNSMEKKYA